MWTQYTETPIAFTIQRLTHSASDCAPHFRVIFTPDITALPTCQFLSWFLNGWFVKPCSPEHSEDLLGSELARCLSCQFAMCSHTFQREGNSHTQLVDSVKWVAIGIIAQYIWPLLLICDLQQQKMGSFHETIRLKSWFPLLVFLKNITWTCWKNLHLVMSHVWKGFCDLTHSFNTCIYAAQLVFFGLTTHLPASSFPGYSTSLPLSSHHGL